MKALTYPILFALFLSLLSLTLSVSAQQNDTNQNNNRRTANLPPKSIEGFHTEIYKSVGDVKLPIHIISPAGHRKSDKRPAAVFFFGGGWRNGTPTQFEHQCRYLASRGMVAMTVEYRVASRHGVKAISCVRDAKSAIRWVRQNAERLGVDPNRIVAGGGSAGGHLAGAVGTIRAFDEENEDHTVSSIPDALALFNPALVLANIEGQKNRTAEQIKAMGERMGTLPQNLSPYHHLSKDLPPTIIFHGRADTTVPFRSAQLFSEKAKELGVRCELVAYDDQPHGFFNYGRGGNPMFEATVKAMDHFLESLDYIQGSDTVDTYLASTN
jgi:acetyl esterase/lipase